MFVKIINHDKEYSIDGVLCSSKCFDCKKYLLRKHEKVDGVAMTELIVDVGEQDERFVLVPQTKTSIIVMNNNGKTIDRIYFK